MLRYMLHQEIPEAHAVSLMTLQHQHFCSHNTTIGMLQCIRLLTALQDYATKPV